MKKTLILSYFFPPCNLTAAQRIGSWANYLSEFGYYPIVVTRNWTGKEYTEQQRLESSGDAIRIEKNKNAEIHYLPYKATWRDRFFIKSNLSYLYLYLSKTLTAFNLIFQNFFIRFIPFNNLYHHARELLINDKTIQVLIISGSPFEQFYFGYLLKKEFPNIKWIADYRDEWTTSEIIDFVGLKKWICSFQIFSEKKWLKKADLITANTNYASEKLNTFLSKKTKKLLNGFDFELPSQNSTLSFNTLKIVHNGTLYPSQDISLLAEALNEIIIPNDFTVQLSFPGIKIYNEVAEKTEKAFKNTAISLLLTERISSAEVLKMQLNADLLLMVAHKGKKGIIGSKLYEYIGLQKRILLCPSDNDELEETLLSTNLGIVVSEKEQLKLILKDLIAEKMKFGALTTNANIDEINKFNRKNQVKLLADYINELG